MVAPCRFENNRMFDHSVDNRDILALFYHFFVFSELVLIACTEDYYAGDRAKCF